jgi:hypothetical protein
VLDGFGLGTARTLHNSNVTAIGRIREIFRAIRSAKFPRAPKRKYDIIGQSPPFTETAGRGRIRDGGTENPDSPSR